MARTIERRTRTVRTEGAEQIKANLTNIAGEIAKVRDQAREEVSALEKIRSMLDAGHLTNLLTSIEELEERIEELEDTSLQSQGAVDGLKAELEQEQDRLAKLWDAYKSQEDELERIKRDYPLMEEKLFERERTIETLRREVTRMEGFEKFKKEAAHLEDENRHLTRDLEKLESENDSLVARVEDLQEEAVHLRANTKDAQRARELESLLEEERERLAKLYKVYEDVESEKDDLHAQVEAWRKWYRGIAPAMESVGDAPTRAPAK